MLIDALFPSCPPLSDTSSSATGRDARLLWEQDSRP
jgi:hypothetical protein